MKRTRPKNLQIEAGIQKEILLRLRTGGWQVIALPHPNSIFIPARTDDEKLLARRLVHQMKETGLLVTGAPDLSLHWLGGSALVEIKRPASSDLMTKRPAGTLTPEQAEIKDRAEAMGVRFVVIHSWDELRRCLEEWGVRRNATAV